MHLAPHGAFHLRKLRCCRRSHRDNKGAKVPDTFAPLSFVVEGSLFQLFKGSAELVWAGSAFCATADAIETFDDVVDMLTAY
jgi:hypothetical protein